MLYSDKVIIPLTSDESHPYFLISNGYEAKSFDCTGMFPNFRGDELADGRVIFSDRYSLYSYMFPSREVAFALFAQYRAEGKTSHDLIRGSFPYDEDFPEHVQELIDSLPTKLGIEASALDYSMESLTVIDRKLIDITDEWQKVELFPMVIAYCGEFMARMVGGKWRMWVTGKGCWQPVIVDEHGNEYNAFRLVQKRFYDERDPESIEENGGDEIYHLDSGMRVELSMPGVMKMQHPAGGYRYMGEKKVE